MDNREFLQTITESFRKFLGTGSRSNEKLKILHGAIAKDIDFKLQQFSGISRFSNRYEVKSLGFKEGKESEIVGRYIDKKVDITIIDKANRKSVAGIAVKFVMQNYSQNSNNYFENMLGETANIRCNGIPYFQIFIIPDKIPYYDKNGQLMKWESFTDSNSHKYEILAKDNPESYFHTPNKTLLYVIHLPDTGRKMNSRNDYIQSYSTFSALRVQETRTPDRALRQSRESSVIFNDYEKFVEKVCHAILSI